MSFAWAKPYEPKTDLGRWFDERLPLARLVYGAIGGGYPVPRNLNYLWNFGVLSGLFLPGEFQSGFAYTLYGASNLCTGMLVAWILLDRVPYVERPSTAATPATPLHA